MACIIDRIVPLSSDCLGLCFWNLSLGLRAVITGSCTGLTKFLALPRSLMAFWTLGVKKSAPAPVHQHVRAKDSHASLTD